MYELSDEWIIGRNPVIEALKSGRSIDKLFVSDQMQAQTFNKVKNLAKQNGITIKRIPRKKMDHMVEGNHQGIAASVAAYEYSDIDDLFEIASSRDEAPFFIILDEIEDPHNLGSILRTADATGVHGVIIPKRRAVGLTATVAKVARVTNIAQTIDELKAKNVWVVGTEADAKEEYRELDGNIPLALVIGNEGKGMSRLVREKCDWTIKLAMKGKVSSLNASVAAALLMYEVYRKRNPIGE